MFSPSDFELTKDMKWYDINARIDESIQKIENNHAVPTKSRPLKQNNEKECIQFIGYCINEL